MSKVIRLGDNACDYLDSFKHYSRCLDDIYGNTDHMIDALSDSIIIEYMMSYAVKAYRDRYDIAKKAYNLDND